jgi:DMSO/TMAO reductase YedYZ heme-binding membrane subunit
MSVGFRAVQWNKSKIIYDLILVTAVAFFIGVFLLIAYRIDPPKDLPAAIDLRIRAFGSCAFLMLTVILSIGPLARLDRRLLPLLYNRRHFGVLTFVIASLHVWFMLEWYAVQGTLPNLLTELMTWADYGKFIGFPFKVLGIAALVVLFLMAATSHDFWLAFLTPRAWKALHMALYVAYGLVVMHVALGIMQYVHTPLIPAMLFGGFGLVAVLHLLAAWREHDRASRLRPMAGSRSARRLLSPTRARASCPRRVANASPCFATAPRSARSPIFAPIRMARSAKAASSTAASPVPGMAISIGWLTAARRRRSPSGWLPTGCGSGTGSWKCIRRRCHRARRHRSHVRQLPFHNSSRYGTVEAAPQPEPITARAGWGLVE